MNENKNMRETEKKENNELKIIIIREKNCWII